MDIPSPQLRARVICTMCHKRKVRCDLQQSPDNVCSNCRRMKHVCIRRRGRRTKAGGSAPAAADSRPVEYPLPVISAEPPNPSSREEPLDEEPGRPSFIASDSVLFDGIPSNSPEAPALNNGRRTEAFLRSISPTILTDSMEEPLRMALLDSFAHTFHHWYPFIDTTRIYHNAPPMLETTLLLAGNLARRISTIHDLRLPCSLYQKAKEMVYSDDGRDPITLLKAITIMACWSFRSPSIISLDGPWHWGGMAMRLALQMGLHQESTYASLQDSDNCRLLWWHLMNSDVLQAACWGRPCLIQSKHQNVEQPQLSSASSDTVRIFVYSTRLISVLRCVIEREMCPLSETVASLITWYQNVPLQFHLHDAGGFRKLYNKATSELWILYLAVVIFVVLRQETTDSHGHRAQVSPTTIAASSCMVRLYEEVYHHDDAARLGSIHGFLLMLAAIPQIFYRPCSPEKDGQRDRHMEHICTVLRQLRLKYGGCDMVLRKIAKLRAESHLNSQQQSQQGKSVPDPQGPFGTDVIDGEVSQHHTVKLFPFPSSFCPNLDLLGLELAQHEVASYQQDASMIDRLAFESLLFDWTFDDSTAFQLMP